MESWTFNAKTMWVAENGNLDENFMRSIPKIPYHGYSCNRCQKILIKKVSESTKMSENDFQTICHHIPSGIGSKLELGSVSDKN